MLAINLSELVVVSIGRKPVPCPFFFAIASLAKLTPHLRRRGQSRRQHSPPSIRQRPSPKLGQDSPCRARLRLASREKSRKRGYRGPQNLRKLAKLIPMPTAQPA